MIIENLKNACLLCDIKYGEVFLYEGSAYIKTQSNESRQYWCIRILDGNMTLFYDSTLVEPVKAKVVIEK